MHIPHFPIPLPPTILVYPNHEIVAIQSEKSISDQVTPPTSSNLHGKREGYDENGLRELRSFLKRLRRERLKRTKGQDVDTPIKADESIVEVD